MLPGEIVLIRLVEKRVGNAELLLCTDSPVGLKSKRFVLETLLVRENRGEGTGKEGGKGEPAGNPRVFEYQPTSRPTAFDITQSVTCQNQANHNRLKM